MWILNQENGTNKNLMDKLIKTIKDPTQFILNLMSLNQ